MPLNNSTNISFSAGNFTSSTPIGGQEALTGFGVNTSSNYRWANKTAQLNLGNTNYGYVMFDISYTVTGTADVVGISFAGPDMPTSYSRSLSGLFKPLLDGTYLKLAAGVTTRIYVIVNATKKSNLLPITLTVGRRGTLPSNVTVNVQYNCTDVGPLYSYLCGLHVYSPYDAANSPALQTYLYSYTPINSWTYDTELYASPNFTQPAYPYYYSYGSNVYKVGNELERSFGVKKYIYVEKKWALGKTRVYDRVEGPKSWVGLDVDGFTTENFVYPIIYNVGKLSQILTSASLVQPSSYRYYLGASSTAQSAADFFTQFDFNNRQVHTITGYMHALQRLSEGFVSGYYKDLKFDWTKFAVTVASLGLALYDYLYVGYDATGWGKILTALARFEVWINSTATTSAGSGGFAGIFGPFAIPLIKIFIVVAALYAIWLLFKSTKDTIQEPSILFKYRYANTPYLNNGTRLYTNTGLTTYKSEYYCDGIYFYNQSSSNTISNKELSYSLNALLDLNPLQKGLAYSIAVDQPDSGSVIYDFTKLLALPYCSGKPDTVSGNNINTAQSVSFTPLNLGGDLLTYPASVTVSLPEGTITTTGSQADANNQAIQYLNQLTGSYVSGSYGTPKTGSAGFGAYFTHEIKVENTPNTGSVFFDNTNGAGLTVGKSLYYDIGGFQKVLNGYYAADSGSVSPYSNYRTFFKTVNGAVTDILAMGSSGATTVTSVVDSATYPVQTSNQNYTSDWYWYQPSYNELSADIPYVTNPYVNPNSLYTTSSLKSGFLLPNTSSFYTYDSISSTASYSEATPGFYYAFTSYENGYMFAYSTATTISINLTEVCFTDYAVGEPYGVNISGATGSASSSLYYPVNLTLSAYNGGSLLTSFPATASAEGVTYVSFPAPITKDSNVTNVTLTIDSPNPNNKVLYVAGTFTNCNPTTPAPTTAAPTPNPTTAAPTPNPTTPSPTPNPTTASPTPNPTAPFSAIVSYSTISALDACNNPQGSFSMTGNNGTFCASSTYTATNWTSLPQNTYWLAYDGQVRQVYHPANANTVTTTNACADCPTPNPTPNPTTAAPTTAAPTPNPTTAAPTTPSPTLPAPFTACMGDFSAASTCNCDGLSYGNWSFQGNGTSLCNSSTISSSGILAEITPGGVFYVSDGSNVREYTKVGSTNTATANDVCSPCPTPNPTPNPTTAAPTPNPTTAAPTNPPTPPPTNPPTPPPTAPFSAIVSYSTISALDACNNPQGSFSMTGNNATFCASSTYTATNWTSLATGTYWLAYNSQVRQVFHPSNANTVTTTNACSVCPTPSPTPNPTTAAPTNPPTPPPTPNPTTAAPTPNPTPNPTAAAPSFSFLVTNGRANSALACATTAKPVTLYAYDSDFSLADRFYSTNTFPYTPFNGNDLWYSNGVYAVQINTSGYPIDAIVCPTPSPTAAPTTAAPTNPPTPPPTNPPTPPPTNPPTPPPTTPPTPPPTTPPTPPPTNPPTTPPTPPPTNPPTTPPTPPPTPPPTIAYFYYNVTPCFSGGSLVARSTDDGLNGVYTANGTCYIIDGITIPPSYDFTIDPANYVGGSCFVSACGYTPPTPAPAPAELYVCDPFIGCYQDPFGDPFNVVCLNCDQV